MAKKSEPTNPFRFGPLALDEGFTNRGEEIRELLADVRNGQDVVILAPRRYGKSSLIWRVAQELVKDGVLVAQIDLMRTPTKDQLASKLAKAIHEELATRVDRVKDGLDVFRGLRLTPTVTIDPNDGSPSFSFEAQASPEDIDATLEELFVRVGKIAADRKRRVALVLDEFQEVADIDKGLVKLMRSVFQQQPEVAHIYLGSKRHMMERIFNDENEPFWRSAKQLPLGVIAPDLFAPYAIDRFAVTGKELGADVCEDALEITGGHPYATQELFYFLWERTPFGGSADLVCTRGRTRGRDPLRALALQPDLGPGVRRAATGAPGARRRAAGAPRQLRLPPPAFAAVAGHGPVGAASACAGRGGGAVRPGPVRNRGAVSRALDPGVRELDRRGDLALLRVDGAQVVHDLEHAVARLGDVHVHGASRSP